MRASAVTVPLALAICLLSTAPGPAARAQAADPRGELAEIRELLLYANYDEAVARARRFLDRADLDAETHNQGLEALARALLANNDDATAGEVLTRLYARDPEHRLSDGDASPAVQAAFARAREAEPAVVGITLRHEPLGALDERASPVVEVEVEGEASAIHELRVAYRVAGETRFERVVMSRQDARHARARLPLVGNPSRAVEYDYYLVAVAPSLTPLARLGSEGEPLRLILPPARVDAPAPAPEPIASPAPAPEPDEGGGVATQWWFWTLVGLAVAGGVAGAVVATSGDSASGSLGTVSLR